MRLATASALLLLLAPPSAWGAPPAAPPAALPKFVFKEAKHAGGELKFVDGVPVVTAAGTPAEIGEQLGELVGKNATDPVPVLQQFLADVRKKDAYPMLKLGAGRLKANIPADHLAEMEALAERAGYELDMVLVANCIYDFSSGMGCSTLIAEKDRSATGGVLFGRLFDWVPTKGLPERTAVVVLKPEKKHAFAMVAITPITGLVSGMNDAGLCVTINEIALKSAKDKSAFDWGGVPTLLAFRRVLEECGTVDEAEKLMKGMKRTTAACMTVADEKGGAVFEITPKSVERRAANKGVCCCCNDFLCDALATIEKPCPRLEKLLAAEQGDDKLGVADVFDRLHSVNQQKTTLQAMVFEPAGRKLHLKLGDGSESATKAKAVTLELGKLLK